MFHFFASKRLWKLLSRHSTSLALVVRLSDRGRDADSGVSRDKRSVSSCFSPVVLLRFSTRSVKEKLLHTGASKSTKEYPNLRSRDERSNSRRQQSAKRSSFSCALFTSIDHTQRKFVASLVRAVGLRRSCVCWWRCYAIST